LLDQCEHDAKRRLDAAQTACNNGFMKIHNPRYVHTNLIARDWRALSDFYQQVFGCTPVPPERDISGAGLEAGTGLSGAHLHGIHLHLPGYDDSGPTLEIFTYTSQLEGLPAAVNRPGYTHLAFSVDDVHIAREAVLAAGGQPIGKVVTISVKAGWNVTWCYVTDPEGNMIELQSWAPAS
jgi:predicted enzyme related to lactoylglutathione lyase